MLGDFLDDTLQRGLRALRQANVRYVLIGGMAMLAYGRNRSTRDMDVLVGELPETLTDACREQGFEHDPRRDRHALPDLALHRYWRDIPEIDLRVSLDVQYGHQPYHAAVLERARSLRIGELEVAIATLEDLLLMKLSAFRPLDRADCVSIVSDHPVLDLAYLEKWLDPLDVRARWEEVLAVAQELATDFELPG